MSPTLETTERPLSRSLSTAMADVYESSLVHREDHSDSSSSSSLHSPRVLAASPFHRLPTALFACIAQFLPLTHKLAQLSRLCHPVPLLTPSCFRHDRLIWTSALSFSLRTKPPLLRLLGEVSSAAFVESWSGVQVDELTALLCPPSIASLSRPFVNLRHVGFFPSEVCDFDLAASVGRFIAGVASLALVESFHLTAAFLNFRPLPRFLVPLPSMSSLRSLQLDVALTSSQLAPLLSLTVEELNLRQCSLTVVDPPPPSLRLSPTVRALLLPLLQDRTATGPLPPPLTEWLSTLLALIRDGPATSFPKSQCNVEAEGGRPDEPRGVDRLYVTRLHGSIHLPVIVTLRQLRVLHIASLSKASVEELAAFYAALSDTSCLPHLQHLSVSHSLMQHRPQLTWPAALCWACIHFVEAYSGQLLTLELGHSSETDKALEPFPPATSRAMTEALLSCRRLTRLKLTAWWLHPYRISENDTEMTSPRTQRETSPSISSSSMRLTRARRLPSLECLHLHCPNGVTEVELSHLLDECEVLQELKVEDSPILSVDALLWIGSRCPALRTLSVEIGRYRHRYDEAAEEEKVDLARWDAAVTSSTHGMPSLRYLSFACHVPVAHSKRIVAFTNIAGFLLRSAPNLHFLALPGFEWLDAHRGLVCLLSPLQHLKGLDLGFTSWMQLGFLSRYWMSTKLCENKGGVVASHRYYEGHQPLPSLWSSYGLQFLQAVTESGDVHAELRSRASSDEEVTRWWSSEGRLFKEEVDGESGRASFFRVITPNPNSPPPSPRLIARPERVRGHQRRRLKE